MLKILNVKKLAVLVVGVFLLTSCSALFWTNRSLISLDEVIEQNVKIVLIDYNGKICRDSLSVKENPDASGKKSTFNVPKFATKSGSEVPVEYLFFFRGYDTTIYQLQYASNVPVPLGGMALGGYSTYLTSRYYPLVDAFEVGGAGFLYGLILIDLPSMIIASGMHSLQRNQFERIPNWRFKSAQLQNLSDLPPHIQEVIHNGIY